MSEGPSDALRLVEFVGGSLNGKWRMEFARPELHVPLPIIPTIGAPPEAMPNRPEPRVEVYRLHRPRIGPPAYIFDHHRR